MQKEIDFAEVFSGGLHEFLDLCVVLDVEWSQESGLSRVCFDAFANAHAVLLLFVIWFIWQVGETAGATLVHNFFSDSPSDRAIICYAEDQAFFTFK